MKKKINKFRRGNKWDTIKASYFVFETVWHHLKGSTGSSRTSNEEHVARRGERIYVYAAYTGCWRKDAKLRL